MIHEMRTYTLRPGTTADFEAQFVKWYQLRAKYSPLLAFWHTEFGFLDRVIHVWPYNDFKHRDDARAARANDQELMSTPLGGEFVVSSQSEILTPAPFMKHLQIEGQVHMGNIYEMRIYTYQSGSIPEVLNRWAEALPHREKYSPLAACWYSELGGLNKFYHVWPYKDLAERDRIRAEAQKDPHWPPPTREFVVRQENLLLVPAEYSPMK